MRCPWHFLASHISTFRESKLILLNRFPNSLPLHSVACCTLALIMNCPWILTPDLNLFFSFKSKSADLPAPVGTDFSMMHINGPERKDIPLRCCISQTNDMFGSVAESKKEKERGRLKGRAEGGSERRGRRRSGRRKQKHVWLRFVIIRDKKENANDCRWERGKEDPLRTEWRQIFSALRVYMTCGSDELKKDIYMRRYRFPIVLNYIIFPAVAVWIFLYCQLSGGTRREIILLCNRVLKISRSLCQTMPLQCRRMNLDFFYEHFNRLSLPLSEWRWVVNWKKKKPWNSSSSF